MPPPGIHAVTEDVGLTGRKADTVSTEIEQLRRELEMAASNLGPGFVGLGKNAFDTSLDGYMMEVTKVITAFADLGLNVTNVGLSVEEMDQTTSQAFSGLTVHR